MASRKSFAPTLPPPSTFCKVSSTTSNSSRRVIANIAEKAGVLDDAFTKEAFLSSLHDWESAVKPAYAEHKIALGYGVYGTPKHVIDGELVPDTESAWGAADWAEKLKSL